MTPDDERACSVESIDELALLSFFGVQPKLLDALAPWPYNKATYEVSQGDMTLSFVIAPASGDVRIMFRYRDQPIYELDAIRIDAVKYHNDNGRESIELILNDQDRVFLRLKPTLAIFQEYQQE